MNSITVLGNLGGDPELRFTNDGTVVLNMSVAENTKYRDRDGKQVERTMWFDVAVWGKRAEALAPHLSKGDKIVVVGPLSTRLWQDREGRDRTALEIRADQLGFAGGSGEAAERPASGRGRQQQRRTGAAW